MTRRLYRLKRKKSPGIYSKPVMKKYHSLKITGFRQQFKDFSTPPKTGIGHTCSYLFYLEGIINQKIRNDINTDIIFFIFEIIVKVKNTFPPYCFFFYQQSLYLLIFYIKSDLYNKFYHETRYLNFSMINEKKILLFLRRNSAYW